MTAKEAREILDRAKKKSFNAVIYHDRYCEPDHIDSVTLDDLQEIMWDMLTLEGE